MIHLWKAFKSQRCVGKPTPFPLHPRATSGTPKIVSPCRHCDLCAAACPTAALVLTRDGGRRLRFFAGRCIGCARCVDACPEQALHFTSETPTYRLTDETDAATLWKIEDGATGGVV